MGTPKTTTTGQAGAQSPQAQAMMALMTSTAQDAGSQMGDLSDIASGDIQLTPQQQQSLSRLQQISGDQGRIQMDENMQAATRAGEDTAIGQTMTGGSFEAIQQALLGAQQLRDTNRQALQQEGQTVEAGLNMPLQYAQAQVAGNQALMSRLVGTAQPIVNYDATIRQLNQTTTQETQQPLAQMAFDGASRVGAAMATGGGSEVVRAIPGGFSGSNKQLIDTYSNPQNYTTDPQGD